MSVVVKNGLLYSDGIPIYRIPDADLGPQYCPECKATEFKCIGYTDGTQQCKNGHRVKPVKPWEKAS